MPIALGFGLAMLLPSLMRNLRVWQNPAWSHAGAVLCMAVAIDGHHRQHIWLPASRSTLYHLSRLFMVRESLCLFISWLCRNTWVHVWEPKDVQYGMMEQRSATHDIPFIAKPCCYCHSKPFDAGRLNAH